MFWFLYIDDSYYGKSTSFLFIKVLVYNSFALKKVFRPFRGRVLDLHIYRFPHAFFYISIIDIMYIVTYRSSRYGVA